MFHVKHFYSKIEKHLFPSLSNQNPTNNSISFLFNQNLRKQKSRLPRLTENIIWRKQPQIQAK